jgi:hypothetical protein
LHVKSSPTSHFYWFSSFLDGLVGNLNCALEPELFGESAPAVSHDTEVAKPFWRGGKRLSRLAGTFASAVMTTIKVRARKGGTMRKKRSISKEDEYGGR